MAAYSSAYSDAWDSDTELPESTTPLPENMWYWGQYSNAYSNAWAIGDQDDLPAIEEPEPVTCRKVYAVAKRPTRYKVPTLGLPPLERS